MATISKQIKAYEKDINAKKPIDEKVKIAENEIQHLTSKTIDLQNEVRLYDDAINAELEKIAKHLALEEELKKCRTEVKALEIHKNTLVEEARAKITEEEAKELIIKRWERTLHSVVISYQEIHTRNLINAIEELYKKYVTTLDDVLKAREAENQLLNSFLIELGYE